MGTAGCTGTAEAGGDEACFVRTVPLREQPGRLHASYLAPTRNRQRCLAPLAVALLATPEVLFSSVTADRETLLDAWWTLLVYHGSLKGVGTSHNALQDIEELMTRYQEEVLEQIRAGELDTALDREQTTPSWARRERLAERISQLTSHMSADENARTFDRLCMTYNQTDGLDLVLATNMVSVGLDAARLALMVVNGQPLTTAEYIQASSRVGRAEVPGIVVANYYRDQARSLSHYESFRAYHESFYRFVEPSSVTPYTYQARLRALHAALVKVPCNSAADRYQCSIGEVEAAWKEIHEGYPLYVQSFTPGVLFARELKALTGPVWVMDDRGRLQERSFPDGLGGGGQLLLVPTPLPASWIAKVLYASREHRRATEDEAALAPSSEAALQGEQDPLLHALCLWARAKPPDAAGQVSTRMLLEVLDAIVAAKSRGDEAGDDGCPADLEQVVLDVLDEQGSRFTEPKRQEALGRPGD
jgi:hypothetical protein